MKTAKIVLLVVLLAGVVASLLWVRNVKRRTIKLVGVVITSDADPRKQLPIGGAVVTAADGFTETRAVSDSSGLFVFALRRRLLRHRPEITFSFRHPEYEPLELTVPVSDRISVAAMVPINRPKPVPINGPSQTIGNVAVRYSTKVATEVNVGSLVRPFVVENTGNLPCDGHPPCSPDGRWKATRVVIPLDAGAENEFRNGRVSCIAGPCPFTRIETPPAEMNRQTVKVSALAWSDTATFLVEAEVVHPMISDLVRNLYPFRIGNTLNFTLPPAAEGVSITADWNAQTIVFPIGPALILDWADCNARSNPDQTRVFRCELKPGYRWSSSMAEEALDGKARPGRG